MDLRDFYKIWLNRFIMRPYKLMGPFWNKVNAK